MSALKVINELKRYARIEKARTAEWFFKTEKGQYGHGDVFIGATVPEQRAIARAHLSLPFPELAKLLKSKIHEHRLTALFILVYRYQKGSPKEQTDIARFYQKNLSRVNNWDLVDASAPQIFGHNLLYKDREVLYRLARSKNLWEKRVAIVATFAFIRANQFEDTLNISHILLNDEHDLIHKACGWMLREVGKRSESVLERFLKRHAQDMPRTMLRYAIEKFPEKKRKSYLSYGT